MKFGHRLSGKIERYDDRGRGTFVAEGKTIAVPFTAVGDEVGATFVRRDHGVNVAKLDGVMTPGPDRVAAPCPHAGICGGCLWQHLSYDAQFKIKLGMINAAFEKAGHLERVSAIEPAVEQFHHRNRMDYVVGWNGEIGLKEFDSWARYVDVKTCLLLNDGVGAILQSVRDWIRECDLQPWDAKFHSGDVRYVVIREGKNTNQRLIVVVVKDFSRVTPEMKQKLSSTLSRLSSSLLLGEQSLVTDLSLAQKFETLTGNPWLEEIVNGVTYRIHPNSFFQTNSKMAGKLQKIVASYVIPSAAEGSLSIESDSSASLRSARNDKILDLYCGLGFFGIFLAKHYALLPTPYALQIHGVEIDAEAIELARFNAVANGVSDQCDFTAAKAEDMSWKDIPADVVILDPPRSGLHPKVLKTVIEKRPETIVYVSCNYKRLVEELKQFKEHYAIEQLAAIDLFPHTPHVEVIAKLVATNSGVAGIRSDAAHTV